jgi:hypothetical protein
LGYNYLLADFRNEYPSLTRFALSYEGGDIPFEIEHSTGKLYYLLSEDRSEFDTSSGEKRFELNVKLTDSASNEIDFFVDVRLIDDDELVYMDDQLITKFFISPNSSKDELIGQIKVLEAFEKAETNLTRRYVEFLRRNQMRFEFEIADSDDYEHLFRLDRFSGLLFANKSIVRLGDKFKKMAVKVSGKVGEKRCHFLVNVYIFMIKPPNEPITIDSHRFESNEISVNVTLNNDEEYFEPKIKLSEEESNVFNANLRYKLLRNEEQSRCEVNWYNGRFKCRSAPKPTENERLSVLIAAYDLENNANLGLTKVNNTFNNFFSIKILMNVYVLR